MFVHVAVVRLRPEVTDAQRADLDARVTELADAGLATAMDSGFDAGIGSPTNADLALVARFPGRDEFGAYLTDDRHRAVIALLREIATDITAVQFEAS
jgi:hypothetical protein